MRKVTCHDCASADVPLNESVNVEERDYCGPCAKKNFPDEASVAGKKIVKTLDPTICTECATDFGDTVIPKLAHYPICDPCQKAIREKTFPKWVKAFLLGIAAIVVFSFCWNWPYYQAYSDLQTANELAADGNYTKGAQLMQSASKKAPEVEDLKTLAHFFQGVAYLQTDQAAKALPLLLECEGKLPDDFDLPSLVLGAQSTIAFEKQDYEAFLKANQSIFEKDSTVVDNWFGVASAYSCLYATKGTIADKNQALHYLAGADKIDSTSADCKFYHSLIAYRIENQKMITREAFKKQFPHGWTKP
jgi:tetratricopeptide (TPR) repeat protein